MRRRQSKPEAAISDEMMSFQHEFVGRGPDRIKTRIVEDLVIVRSFGVLTPAERQLAADILFGRAGPQAAQNPWQVVFVRREQTMSEQEAQLLPER
jgi:hypothetical protein